MTHWEARGLTGRVDGFTLGPVDLTIDGGETVAVLGPSGAGKTTLLRSLAGLLPPVAGRLLRDGEDLTDRPPESRRIAYVPQGLGLFPHLTVSGNVAYPLTLRGSAGIPRVVDDLLARFGLGSLRRRRPSTLSTGEQQRVAIARALAASPELLLWDEPLVALDLIARDDLMAELREVQEREGLPIIVVSHDPSVAYSLADRFLLLDRGAPIYAGAPEGIRAAPPTAFAARFAGFENVYTPADLGASERSGLSTWLSARRGPGGVCLPSPGLVAAAPGAGQWSARVRHVEPGPGAWRYVVDAEGLRVRLAGPGDRRVRPGDRVEFSVEAHDLTPIGGAMPPEPP